MTFRPAILLLLLLPLTVSAADFGGDLVPFLEKHCLECHDELSAKGGLDLHAALDQGLEGTGAVHLWTRIHDRVREGEMPPAKQPRPEAGETGAFLERLAPDLTIADRNLREVVLRRLNRVEYEHTMRDLFGIEVDLVDLLPEDQSAGGFDNNGEALAVSAELFEQYPVAVRRVLDEVIQFGPRPESNSVTISSLREVEPYLGKLYAHLEGRITTYMTEKTQYSKISTRDQRTPLRGRYRFRFTAAAVNTGEPLVFAVTASDFKSAGAVYKNLGYFEAGKEPRPFEVEAVLDKGFAIQFFALGLPLYVRDPTTGTHPGIGWSEVEMTGPLHETWPPAPHSALLGDLDPDKATLADAREIIGRFLPRAWRREVADEEVEVPLALVAAALEEGRPFAESLRLGFEAALCSPNFLFLR